MATQEFNPPPNPLYPEMIMAALDGLNEEAGSNKTSISRYIESKYQYLPHGHPTLLKHHLNRMKDCGQLIFVKNNYMRPKPDFIKRGRGRPPKAKDEMPASDGSAKPRGRPSKDGTDSGDPSGTSVPLKKNKMSTDDGEQPMKPARGRDPSGTSVLLKKNKMSTDNGEQPMKPARGRGKPPKAKRHAVEGVSAEA